MTLNSIKRSLLRNAVNAKGWKTRQKIVVIESDDWGSIRMPSRAVYERLLQFGVRVDRCHYCKYDALESNDDLDALFSILRRHKDSSGNHPVVTANCIMANPDFDEIRRNDFQLYSYEHFTTTIKRSPQHQNVFNLWHEGMADKLFQPQFHGREHLNVSRWMKALQEQSKETRFAFDNYMFGISAHVSLEKRASYMAALDFDNASEIEGLKAVIKDGLRIFHQYFGFHSESFIAPNYVWHPSLEEELSHQEVRYIQGANLQRSPQGEHGAKQWIRHHTGDKNEFGQRYISRNCFFEPSEREGVNWVDKCLQEIGNAFFWNTPAVISAHRVNFIGSIDESNRAENLKLLDELLAKITNRWPDVRFMSTDSLGDFMIK